MAIIKIPKTPRSAYNPDRAASDLLRSHVSNLEKAVGRRSPRQAQAMTEGEAAAYIRQLSRELHSRTLLPEVAEAPTIDQKPPARPAAKAAAAKRKPRKPRARATARKGRR